MSAPLTVLAPTIIADHTGSFVVEFWADGDEIMITRSPVIAWRISPDDDWATPLSFGCLDRDEECSSTMAWCVEHHDHGVPYSYEFANANTFSSLDEARENARRLIAERRRLVAGSGGRLMDATWTFELSRVAECPRGRRRNTWRGYIGDYGMRSATASSEAEARVIVSAECHQPYADITIIAGDLISVALDGETIWENRGRRGEPLQNGRQRSAAALAALRRAGRDPDE